MECINSIQRGLFQDTEDCKLVVRLQNANATVGFDTGFFARGGNHIFEEILDIFGQQNRQIQL